jgi:SAM-dependent methyltransferase
MGRAQERPPALGRRQILLAASAFVGTALGGYAALGHKSRQATAPISSGGRDLGDFERVFSDHELQARFRPFLEHVFHLLPERDLTALIVELVAEDPRDPVVYQKLLARLPEIQPVFAGPRYALPALNHQKRVMAEQSARLLGSGSKVRGYLELGSHGRYFDALQGQLDFDGPLFTSAPETASYSLTDVVDRGQISHVGTRLPWTDYAPLDAQSAPIGALDLITVYIGLHHASVEQRVPYIRWLHGLLRPGGRLLLRDHDVPEPDQFAIVSLAHDVFNAGTGQSWVKNERERRNFYPLSVIVDLFAEQGFRVGPERLLQDGDPTRNTLLCFSKV